MKKFQTLLLSLLLLVISGFSQSQSEKPIVIKASYFDVSPPLRDMVQQFSAKADISWKENIVRNPLNVFSPSTEKSDPAFIDPLRQSAFGQVKSDTTIQNFEGIAASGSLPPDTDGDVSPDYYFQVVNTRYKIFNKSGVGVYGPFNSSTIFTGLPNNSNDGDAIVLYDENADRWLFSQFSLPNLPNGPFYENVAISQTNDPTGSWYRYQFTFSVMPDYPKLSVWPDAYYMTIRRFTSGSGNWLGPAACALDRTKMLAGDNSAAMVMFNLPSSSEGPLSLDCDSGFPPLGTPNYVSYLVSSPPQLSMYQFHVDWTNPSNSTFNPTTPVPISSFSTYDQNNVIPQKGTSQKIDGMSRKKLMFRMPFRKFSDHWSAVACFTVTNSGIAAVRWMELRNSGSGWSLYQEGTYSPDNNYRWMPSIAMDTSGNIALGYSISSSSMYPSIRYTGRTKNDPLGTMTIAEKGIMNGNGSQTDATGRWGDYSSMSVDPATPGTFWYTNQYYSTTSDASWQTRIASFSIGDIFASYATAAPLSICEGVDSVQLESVAYGGSGSYTYSWTSIPAGFVSTLKAPKTAPTQNTQYAVAVSDGAQTRNDTTLMVAVTPPPYAFAGYDTIVDPSVVSIDLHGIASGYSQILWQTTGNGTFGNNSQLNTTYTFGSVDKTNKAVSLKLYAIPIHPCTGNYISTRNIALWTVGVQNISSAELSLNIQPNPARDNVSITISGLENTAGTLTIVNIKGQTAYTADLIPESTAITKQIDLSNYAKGVYIVRLKTDRSIVTKKLVVQ